MNRQLSRVGLIFGAAALMILTAGAAVAHDVSSAADVDELFSADKNSKDKGKGGKGAQATAPAEKPGDDKPFDTVIKDMEVTKGLFTIYRKAEDNKTLIEILPDQLDKMFLFAGTIDQATGERGFYGAQVGADFPFVFRRFGKTVQWVQKNTMYKAPEGSPEARATARSFANAILGSAKIQSKPHPERKSLLVDATEMFGSRDLPGIALGLNQAYQPTNYSFDKERSGVIGAKVFPENVLFDVTLHFATENPRTSSITLADTRSIPVLAKYEISTLKQTTYQPRIADDRLGHFHTIQQDFTSDHPMSPYVRYITRWNLEKTDPTAAVSPVKEPIVFWLENTIPVEYRAAITEGTLLWNKAFEKAGYKDAVVVKQQPDDADWDPADTRYNTIRWFAGVDATFAIGPSRANPFTGQIYDADISISEGIIRNARRVGEELVSPVSMDSENRFQSLWSRNARWQCEYSDGLAQQAALGMTVLESRGMLSPEVEQKLMHQYILELTAHEVGHTLGLRHNFRASTILKVDELNDPTKCAQIGQSASVMDYNPIIIAGKGQAQGDFLPIVLGPYDYWVIEYAYKPIQGDEKAELGKIAARAASDPMLPYSTDEDAMGTYSAISIDPLANQYDQSTDPLDYFEKRVEMVNELWHSMEGRLARPGEGYQILRRAMGRGMNEYYRASLTASKMVGGIYHVRDHVGDPGSRSPYTPVPAVEQREALDFLSANTFSEKAFVLPASVMNKLAVERLPSLDWSNYYNIQRLDYPWHNAVMSVQRGVLDRLYNSVTLARIQDNELRFGAKEKPFRMVDLFNGLNASIWSELDSGAGEIHSLRRNLQREQLRHLVRLTVRQPQNAVAMGFGPAAVPPLPPEDATTLARASLTRLQSKIRTRLAGKGAIEATTRAHLSETMARIDAALTAQMEKRID
jgi:hypothetical protein